MVPCLCLESISYNNFEYYGDIREEEFGLNGSHMEFGRLLGT